MQQRNRWWVVFVLVAGCAGTAELCLAAQSTTQNRVATSAVPPAPAVKLGAPPRTLPSQTVTVNLNTATAAELERLPGIGARVAARIVAYRQKSGGFKKSEELMNVPGIGEKAFLKLRGQVTVTSAPATPR